MIIVFGWGSFCLGHFFISSGSWADGRYFLVVNEENEKVGMDDTGGLNQVFWSALLAGFWRIRVIMLATGLSF